MGSGNGWTSKTHHLRLLGGAEGFDIPSLERGMGTSACRLTGKAEEILPVLRGWKLPAWKATATHNRLSLTNFAGKWFSKQSVWQETLQQGGHFGTLAALPCSFHSTRCGKVSVMGRPGAAASLGRGNLSSSLWFTRSLDHCRYCHLPLAPSSPASK